MALERCRGVPPLLDPEPNIRLWRRHAGPWRARVVLHLPCGTAPAAFALAALSALRQDAEEDVVVLAASHSSAAARALRQVPGVNVVYYTAGVNKTLDFHAHFALIAADHVATEHASIGIGRAQQRARAGAPYHASWVWCAADGSACSASRPRDEHSHIVVEARPAAERASEGALEVRTTLSDGWVRLPSPSISTPLSASLPRGMWARNYACAGFGHPRAAAGPRGRAASFVDRRAMLLQAEPLDGADTLATPRLLWPLRWPRHFADGDPRPFASSYDHQEASFRDVARWFDTTASPTRPRGKAGLNAAATPTPPTWHRRPAVVVEATIDNIFHMLFHVVPLREDLLGLLGQPDGTPHGSPVVPSHAGDSRGAARAGAPRVPSRPHRVPSAPGRRALPHVELVPRYTVLWPGSSDTRAWVGWNLMSRVLSATLGQPAPTAEHTESLLRPLSLHCFPTLMGGHSPFWPIATNASQLKAARPRLAALRQALWRSLRSGGSGHLRSRPPSFVGSPVFGGAGSRETPMPMLFVVRRSSVRSIVNLDEVHSAIDAQPTLRGRVRYLSHETLSLTEQLAAVSSSRILIGAHGQGMVWSAMLPTGGHSPLTAPTFVSSSPAAERFAALELFPKQATTQHTHAWFDIRRKRHTRILHTHA